MSRLKKSTVLLEAMEDLHPRSIDLSLDRIYSLLQKLDDPQNKLPPVVHIAGTNGKGSVLAFLQAILEAHGDKVHRFSSPHLVRFHERVHLASNGSSKEISESNLIHYLQEVRRANGSCSITFFEITTAMALLAFSETPADWCLLETGLGGRLDATNVVDKPAATIISPISIDHTGFLGETISKIAFEKAGILKTEVPLFSARQVDEAEDVIARRARLLNVPQVTCGGDFDAFEQNGRLVFSTEEELIDLPMPRNLIGTYQVENAGLALSCAKHLLGERLDIDALSKAMETAHWPARMQRIHPQALSQKLQHDDEVWLDGGHNVGAAGVVANTISELEERVPRPLHLVFGMMENKDVRGYLKQFIGLAELVVTVPIVSSENGMDPDILADTAIEMGFEAESARSIEEALQISAEGRHSDVRVLICGSLYLAGHVLKLVELNNEQICP